MGKRKTNIKTTFHNTIITSSEGIVCKETQINLSDEKLRGLLLRVYEQARKDAKKFKPYNYYTALFSVFFSLLIPILSADFKDFAGISGKTIYTICCVICIASFIIGFLLLIYKSGYGTKSETDERDSAITSVFSTITSSSMNSSVKDYSDIKDLLYEQEKE